MKTKLDEIGENGMTSYLASFHGKRVELKTRSGDTYIGRFYSNNSSFYLIDGEEFLDLGNADFITRCKEIT